MLTRSEPFRALLIECGVTNPDVAAEPGSHLLDSPEDWWTIIMGSGYRSTVEALAVPIRERVKLATVEAVRQNRIEEIRTDVIYALARKV